MTVIKIILILGLGYVALNQKVEKTRNMLLIFTGLLAFCMFSVEGFDSITFDQGGTDASTGGTITSDNNVVYTFLPSFNLDGGTLSPTYTCGTNEVKGDMVNSGSLSPSTVEGAFPCVPKQLCSAADAALTCPSGKSKKTGVSDYCTGETCVESDFSPSGPCCETDNTEEETGVPCTADKCNTWSWGADCPEEGSCGEKCETGILWDTYCEETSS